MNDKTVVKFIEDILNSDYHYDESIGYQLTSDDFEWLEYIKNKLTPVNPIIVKKGKNVMLCYGCPSCGMVLQNSYYDDPFDIMHHISHCEKCGQTIQWINK